MKSKNNKKNIFKIILDILAYIFVGLIVLLVIFSLFLTISSTRDKDGTATVFNYQLRIVESTSMEKSDYVDTSKFEIKDIKLKSCIFIETVPEETKKRDSWYESLKEGDVLTFKYVYVRQETITHRIISIDKKEDSSGYIIKLQGDNRTSETSASIQTIDTSLENSSNYVIGKVVGQSYLLGLLIYTIKTPIGIICVFIIPSSIIIIYEIYRISRVIYLEKKSKQIDEVSSKEKEIEELKKKLEEYEKNVDSQKEINNG